MSANEIMKIQNRSDTMNVVSENIKNGIKNPLGIIGLFLVITEAIASMVIMNSELNDTLNLILVLFIVLFPFAVLVVFYLLVSHHHEKLYSPSDYQDENNFVTTYEYNNMTKQREKAILEETTNCNKEINKGMTIEDVDFLKSALLSIMDTQAQILSDKQDINVIEEKRNLLEESIDDYIFEKEEKFEFRVEVSKIFRSNKLVSILKKKYNAAIYLFDRFEEVDLKTNEHSSIWLGDLIPLEMAIDVIKTSKKLMPHLKYIQLNNLFYEPEYVRYEIFIGGSTQTAIERGLYEMKEADFNALYEMKDINQLHKYINDKNTQ